MHLNQLPEALKEAETAIALEPENAYGHRNRALVLLDLKRKKDALPAALEAVRLAPKEPVVYHTLTRAQIDNGKISEASKTAERLCELAPEWYFTHETVSLIAWHRNDWPTMETSARTALALDPESGTAMHYLAVAQLNQKRRAEAIESLYEAARLDPRNQQVRRELRRVVEEHTTNGLIFLAAILVSLTVLPVGARFLPSVSPLAMTGVAALLILGSVLAMIIMQRRSLRRLAPAVTQFFEQERRRENERLARTLAWVLGWGSSIVGTLLALAFWGQTHQAHKPVPWYLPVLTITGAAVVCVTLVGMIRADRITPR
jgi:tetratricopeptide (TPR) repeat protein